MRVDPRAGKPTVAAMLVDVPRLMTAYGWSAARPFDTEDIYKVYAKSFTESDHLRRIQEDAQAIIRRVLRAGGRN